MDRGNVGGDSCPSRVTLCVPSYSNRRARVPVLHYPTIDHGIVTIATFSANSRASLGNRSPHLGLGVGDVCGMSAASPSPHLLPELSRRCELLPA